MSKNEQEILLDLDEALKQMAEETPEAPEGFHDAWVRAVQEDQRNPENFPEEAPVSHASGSNRKRSIPWTRITSIAAAFVVLFAGTCVIGSQRLTHEHAAGKQSAEFVSLSADSVPKSGAGQSASASVKASTPRQADAEGSVIAGIYEEAAVMAEAEAPSYEKAPVMFEEAASVDEADASEDACDEAPALEASAVMNSGAATADVNFAVMAEDCEEVREQNLPARIWSAFVSGLREIGQILSNAAVFPIPAIPVLAVLVLLILAIRIIAKKHKAKRSPENHSERK